MKQQLVAVIDDLLHALELDPKDNECLRRISIAYCTKGTNAIMNGNFLDAIHELDQAISYQPDIGNYYYERARAYYFLEVQFMAFHLKLNSV